MEVKSLPQLHPIERIGLDAGADAVKVHWRSGAGLAVITLDFYARFARMQEHRLEPMKQSLQFAPFAVWADLPVRRSNAWWKELCATSIL